VIWRRGHFGEKQARERLFLYSDSLFYRPDSWQREEELHAFLPIDHVYDDASYPPVDHGYKTVMDGLVSRRALDIVNVEISAFSCRIRIGSWIFRVDVHGTILHISQIQIYGSLQAED